jgi:hypothetical protein
MTEKEIQLLGFQQEYVGEYEGDDDYYYALDIVDGLTFITPCASEVKDEEWYAEVFNTSPYIRFYEFGETQALLNTLTNAIVKEVKK